MVFRISRVREHYAPAAEAVPRLTGFAALVTLLAALAQAFSGKDSEWDDMTDEWLTN